MNELLKLKLVQWLPTLLVVIGVLILFDQIKWWVVVAAIMVVCGLTMLIVRIVTRTMVMLIEQLATSAVDGENDETPANDTE